VPDVIERRGPYRESHLTALRDARDSGRVVMAGVLGDPPRGAVIVFQGVEASEVEAFAREDPYVKAELVSSWRVEPWNVVVSER
jgi:uncharacterized protein YciI